MWVNKSAQVNRCTVFTRSFPLEVCLEETYELGFLLIDWLVYHLPGTTKNWIAVEGALFSTSNYDTSLAALNSKLGNLIVISLNNNV